MLPDAAVEHYRRQQQLAAATVLAARREWAQLGSGVDFDVVWRRVGPRLLVLLATAQRAAARDAAAYIGRVLGELALPDDPAGQIVAGAFAGVASDGRPLDTLLYEPVITAKQAVAAGARTPAALSTGLGALERIMLTQVSDAGRGAESVGIAARPAVRGYVRMLQLPSCSRCAVLAGKFFRWNTGFSRHPNCDCRHIPAPESMAGDLTTDPVEAIRAGQVTGLSRADAKAIGDGADAGQVINARRGMYTADTFGRQVKATTEGTTRRGFAGKRLEGAGEAVKKSAGERYNRVIVPRLRPESIYRIAGDDRGEAIRLLRRFGYLT